MSAMQIEPKANIVKGICVPFGLEFFFFLDSTVFHVELSA